MAFIKYMQNRRELLTELQEQCRDGTLAERETLHFLKPLGILLNPGLGLLVPGR